MILGFLDVDVSYALLVGMVVTVNPCGFAMLPAYLSYFLNLDAASTGSTGSTGSTVSRIARALVVSLSLSAGFLSVFLVLGTTIHLGVDALYDVAQWATLVIGVALVVLGIAMLFGYRLPFFVPKLDRGGRSQSVGSMFVFGVSYAVASLGCSLPTFLIVLFGSAKRSGWVSGAISFLFYGLGFALVLTALTVSLALAQGGFLRVLRRAMRVVDQAAAVLLILAGAYVAWYGWTEVRGDGSGVTDQGFDISSTLTQFLDSVGAGVLAAVLGSVVVGAVGVVLWRRRQRTT